MSLNFSPCSTVLQVNGIIYCLVQRATLLLGEFITDRKNQHINLEYWYKDE